MDSIEQVWLMLDEEDASYVLKRYRDVRMERQNERLFVSDLRCPETPLRRYALLMHYLRINLRETLSGHEMQLIAKVLNGSDYSFAVHDLQLRLAQELRDGGELNFQTEREAFSTLADKVAKLTTVEALALVDAVEEFWIRVRAGEQPNYEAILA